VSDDRTRHFIVLLTVCIGVRLAAMALILSGVCPDVPLARIHRSDDVFPRNMGFIRQDTQVYVPAALALLQHHTFVVDPDHPTDAVQVVPPGYPFLLALAIAAGVKFASGIALLQILLAAGTVLLTYKLAELLIPRRASSGQALVPLIGAGIVALDFGSVRYTCEVLTETSFTLALLAATCALLLFISRPTTGHAILTGALFVAATFIRAVTYYLLPLIALFMFIWAYKRRAATPARWFTGPSLAAVLIILTIGGWQARNLALNNNASFCSIAHVNMLFYRAAGVLAEKEHISFAEARNRLGYCTIQKRLPFIGPSSGWMMRKGIEIVLQHPFLYIKVAARGLVRMLVYPAGAKTALMEWAGCPDGGSFFEAARWAWGRSPAGMLALCWEGVSLIALWGGSLLSLIHAKRFLAALPRTHILAILGILVYLAVISAGPEADARFRIPMVPLWAVLSAFGWAQLLYGNSGTVGDSVGD